MVDGREIKKEKKIECLGLRHSGKDATKRMEIPLKE